MILPPGTILQQMLAPERLRSVSGGRFIEVGAGQGIVSKTLLDLGGAGARTTSTRSRLPPRRS